MNPRILLTLVAATAAFVVGCPSSSGESNPFITLSDQFGIVSGNLDTGDSSSGGQSVDLPFRQSMTLTLWNQNTDVDIETLFMAWVDLSSIRSTEQEDALIASGYTRLTEEVTLGTVFVLPVGTFVYGGPGAYGATPVELGYAGAPVKASVLQYQFVTPDVLLVFDSPPVSCDSIAYKHIEPRGSVSTGPSTSVGGFKTFAQIDAYQCYPLQPGLFFKSGGGSRQTNEFFEGASVLFQFSPGFDELGNSAFVTISSTVPDPAELEAAATSTDTGTEN